MKLQNGQDIFMDGCIHPELSKMVRSEYFFLFVHQKQTKNDLFP